MCGGLNTTFNQPNKPESIFYHLYTIPQPHQGIEHYIQSAQQARINFLPFVHHSPATPGDWTLSSISPTHQNQLHAISTPFPNHTRGLNTTFNQPNKPESIFYHLYTIPQRLNTEFNQPNTSKSITCHFYTIPQPCQGIKHWVQSAPHIKINDMAFPYHSLALSGDSWVPWPHLQINYIVKTHTFDFFILCSRDGMGTIFHACTGKSHLVIPCSIFPSAFQTTMK